MRVHERIVIDILTGQVLEDDFYYTDQKPALCDFGTTVNAPPPPAPTQTEKDLQQEQLDQLKKANLYSDLITPASLASSGYKAVTGPDGKQTLVQLSPEERLATMSPLDRSMYEMSLREMGLSATGAKLSEEEILANMAPGEKRAYELSKQAYDLQKQSLEMERRRMGLSPEGTPLSDEEVLASMPLPERRAYELAQQNYQLEKASLNLQQRQLGLSSTGEILTEEELVAQMTPVERRNYELEKQYYERSQQALAGTLPVSPALEADLAAQEKAIADSLSQRLGPNWMLSTPGIKTMAEFKQKAELLREEARRGAISTGEALLYSSAGRQPQGKLGLYSYDQSADGNYSFAPNALNVGSYLNTLSGETGNKLYSVPQLYSGLTQATGGVMAPYQGERMKVYENQVSAAMQSSANKAALYGSLIKGVAVGGGIAAAGIWSSEVLKKNIKKIESPVDKIMQVNGVSFDWKKDGNHDIGVIAEQVEKIMPEAVMEENGIKGVYYYKLIPLLIEAIKTQQAQIIELQARG